mmetsp:Transcript_43079/g.88700  ORF Transcript_43079/g.88700 Transcript_43079/m.88700 type:complete len:91 (+) Transcript_43079:98-370(+)
MQACTVSSCPAWILLYTKLRILTTRQPGQTRRPATNGLCALLAASSVYAHRSDTARSVMQPATLQVRISPAKSVAVESWIEIGGVSNTSS